MGFVVTCSRTAYTTHSLASSQLEPLSCFRKPILYAYRRDQSLIVDARDMRLSSLFGKLITLLWATSLFHQLANLLKQLVELVGLSDGVAVVDAEGYKEEIRHCLAFNLQDAAEHVAVVGRAKSLKHRGSVSHRRLRRCSSELPDAEEAFRECLQ